MLDKFKLFKPKFLKELNGEPTIGGLPVWIFVISPIILLVSITTPFRYFLYEYGEYGEAFGGYFKFVRLVTCVTAGIISFSEYKNGHKHQAVLAALVALVFNPVFVIVNAPEYYDEETWPLIIVLGVAGLWLCYLWHKGAKAHVAVAILVVVTVFVLLSALKILEIL